ncbi:MAG: energy transducer TonB [Muribaculaceae bacterium]|nr:energy transducer TonB [Muribaculaceae bacterium]
MAKDVDLSSKEWLDLVFEGKNKEFGAYELRSDSPRRHNKSVLYTLIGIAICALLAYGWAAYNKWSTERRLEQERLEQEALAKQMEQEMEEEEVQQEIEIPEEKEQILEEEIQNSQKVTEMAIVPDDQVKEPPKTIDAQKEDERQVGAVNEDRGTDDITKPTEQTHQEVVQTIVEPPKEEKKEEPKPEPKKEEPKPEKEEVFSSAAHMPSYPGGDAALMKYLSDHLRYPETAASNNIQGKVIVQFVVTKTGKIGEVKVARSVDKDLDREAVRVCKSLPAFSPGRNAVGDPVNVWYTLPVTFKLQGVN